MKVNLAIGGRNPGRRVRIPGQAQGERQRVPGPDQPLVPSKLLLVGQQRGPEPVLPRPFPFEVALDQFRVAGGQILELPALVQRGAMQ